MKTETKTFFKIFPVWQDDREEIWLREKAREGWHLVKPRLGGYTFRRGEPQDMVYRMDFSGANSKDERQAYFDLFEQAGWELVAELAGWQYFRKPARAGEVDELYTDHPSKIMKHTREMILFGVLLIFLGLYLVNIGSMPFPSRAWQNWLTACMLPAILLDGYTLFRIWLRVRDLKGM